jgi:hypothetical protein
MFGAPTVFLNRTYLLSLLIVCDYWVTISAYRLKSTSADGILVTSCLFVFKELNMSGVADGLTLAAI